MTTPLPQDGLTQDKRDAMGYSGQDQATPLSCWRQQPSLSAHDKEISSS